MASKHERVFPVHGKLRGEQKKSGVFWGRGGGEKLESQRGGRGENNRGKKDREYLG